jgi:hypothetical protein
MPTIKILPAHRAVEQDVAPLTADNSLVLTAVVKVVSGNNVDANCQDFVNRLLM